MADILIRGYKAKEQIEEIIEEARYAANNCMIGSGLEIIELPAHGDLIEAEPIKKFITDGLNSGEFGHDTIEVLTEVEYAPVIVPASEEDG